MLFEFHLFLNFYTFTGVSGGPESDAVPHITKFGKFRIIFIGPCQLGHPGPGIDSGSVFSKFL